jgi:hypothetical protein
MFFFIILLCLFILATSFILRSSKKASKEFLLVISISGLTIATFGFFFHSYKKFDALIVVFLLILTVALCAFFSTRKYG